MAEYQSPSPDENQDNTGLEIHELSPESSTANEDKISLDEKPNYFNDEALSILLNNATFPDRDRTPLIKHCSDVENLLRKEVDCDDETAIIAAKVGGIKHMMLDKNFCEFLKMKYGEEVSAACFQIATYDYHDEVVDCNCRDLRCHAGNGAWRGFGELWICFCNSSVDQDTPGQSAQQWKVLKNRSGCNKEKALKECLRKRRRNKLRSMCESAKVALLGWMVVMVRRFGEGHVPVDWDLRKVYRYMKDLEEMCNNLHCEKTQNLLKWLAQHPSNKIILKLRMIFLREIRSISLHK